MESEFVKRLMEHRSMLHSFVYALLRDPHLTEDILQEVAVVLWSKYSEFAPGTDFGAWARSVAYREILAARRSEARAHRYMDDACAQEILAAYQRREETVDSATHRQALARCMGQLNPDLRDIMRCRYALSMSSREIAHKFSRTAQAVDAIVYRIKRLLSDCIRSRVTTAGDAT
ncbi:MAG: sigma-70 family RNA polymerase sigma factor [Planctomycetota bacterium]|nr:MAG: sigma-70 family RNA polymerase sigma factor [Planctomycetota bacterium]